MINMYAKTKKDVQISCVPSNINKEIIGDYVKTFRKRMKKFDKIML